MARSGVSPQSRGVAIKVVQVFKGTSLHANGAMRVTSGLVYLIEEDLLAGLLGRWVQVYGVLIHRAIALLGCLALGKITRGGFADLS